MAIPNFSTASTAIPPGTVLVIDGDINSGVAQEVRPEPADANQMTPTDFVLWLNGVIDVLDSTPPTQSQWDTMREKVAGQVGAIIADRIRLASKPTYYSGYADTSAKTTQQASISVGVSRSLGASAGTPTDQSMKDLQALKAEAEAFQQKAYMARMTHDQELDAAKKNWLSRLSGAKK